MSKVLHISKAGFAILLLAAFIAAFFLYRYQYARLGAVLISKEIERRTDLSVSILRLGGNLWDTLELCTLSVAGPDGLDVSVEVVEVRYTLMDLIRNGGVVDEVRVIQPSVRLPVATDVSREESGRALSLPPVFARKMSIVGGSLLRGEREVRGVELAVNFAGEDEQLHAQVESLTALLIEPSGDELPVYLEGDAWWKEVSACSLALRGNVGETNWETRSRVDGMEPIRGRGRLTFRPIEVSQLLGFAGIQVPFDDASATVDLDFRGSIDTLSATLAGDLHVDNITAEKLSVDFRRSGTDLALERFEGEVNGALIRGDGRFSLGGSARNGFRLFFDALDARQFAADAFGDKENIFRGNVSWTGSGTELASLRGRFTANLNNSRIGPIFIKEADIGGALRDGGVSIDRSDIRTRRSRLEFGGVVGFDGSFEGDLLADLPSVDEFRSFTPFHTLSGEASLSGTIAGTLDQFRAEGRAELSAGHVEGIGYESVEADGWMEQRAGITIGGGRGTVRQVAIGTESADSLRLMITLAENSVQIRELAGWRDEWYLGGIGSVVLEKGTRLAKLDSLQLSRSDSVLVEPGPITLYQSGGVVRLDTVAFPYAGGDVRIAGSIGPGDSIDVDFGVQSCDLSTLADRSGVPAELLRRITVDGKVSGTRSAPEGDCFVRIAEGAETDSLPFRLLTASANFSGGFIDFDSLVILGHGKNARLVLAGVAPLPGDSSHALDLTVSARQYPLEELHFLTGHLDPYEGLIHLDATLGGTWHATNADAVVRLDSMYWYGYPMGTVVGDTLIINGDSLLSTIRLEDDWGKDNRIFFRHPVRFSLADRDLSLLDEGPFRSKLDVPDGDFGLVAAFTELLEETGGRFRMYVVGGGDRSDPDLDGEIDVEDGFVLPARVAAYFQDVSGRALVDEDYLSIVRLGARSNNGGRLDVWGRVDKEGFIPTRYDLGAKAKDFELLIADEIQATGSGEFRITPDPGEYETVIPFIQGETDLSELLIEAEFEEEVEDELTLFDPTAAPEWTCDLWVRAPTNITVRNSAVDAELGGDVHLTRSTAGLGAVGELEFIRGSYWIVNTQFRVVEGRVLFRDPNDMREVYLDVSAVTDVGGERIDASVIGEKDSLTAELSSASGLSDGEILNLLAFRSGTEGTASSGIVGSMAAAFARRAAQAVSSSLPDVGTFEIGTSDDLPEIRYGNYLSSDFYLGFSTKVGSQNLERSPENVEVLPIPDRQIRVEYRLQRSLVIEGEAGTFTDGDRFFNLDLKVRLPY